MTCRENLARLLPLHYQRICELAAAPGLLDLPSRGRWGDLSGLFQFSRTSEGHDYWRALATGDGIR